LTNTQTVLSALLRWLIAGCGSPGLPRGFGQIAWASSSKAAARRRRFTAGFNTEFVVATAQVLNERVTADHVRSSLIRSQPAQWFQSCFESAVIVLDPIVRVPTGVMKRIREQLIDNAVDVPPDTSDFDVGLINKPAVPQHCAAMVVPR
jgi:hypothetical protein